MLLPRYSKSTFAFRESNFLLVFLKRFVDVKLFLKVLNVLFGLCLSFYLLSGRNYDLIIELWEMFRLCCGCLVYLRIVFEIV